MGRSFSELRLIGEDRIWIDSRGGLHVLDRSHARAFEATYGLAYGTVVPSDAGAWMERYCGSRPDNDGDNPGWQWVDYAKRVLGWARITVNVWMNKTEIAVEFESSVVTMDTFRALLSLMRYIQRNAPSDVIMTDDVGHCGDAVSLVFLDYRSFCDTQYRTREGHALPSPGCARGHTVESSASTVARAH